jgi:glyoxalase superfamily protein
MAVRYQLVVNCADPEPLARFWAAALGYELEPPPAGFATWDDFRRSIGLPDSFLGVGTDSIIDPDHAGPRIWFQVVPDAKTITNRLHLDIHASGDRALPLAVRRERVDAEAQRLAKLGATWVASSEDAAPDQEGLDHYAVAMRDPEGNEFDIN